MTKEELGRLLHDLRSPLNTISMNAELGLMMCESDMDKEKLEKVLSVIVSQCEHMADQLNLPQD